VDLNGRTVVLVDDVLYTGRTIRAAMDALVDFGRPRPSASRSSWTAAIASSRSAPTTWEERPTSSDEVVKSPWWRSTARTPSGSSGSRRPPTLRERDVTMNASRADTTPDVGWRQKHLLDVDVLSLAEIQLVMRTTDAMKEVLGRPSPRSLRCAART